MNENYLRLFQLGLPAQIREIPLDELLRYIHNHLNSFLIDTSGGACLIDRLSADPAINHSPEAQKMLLYLMDKILQLCPLKPGFLESTFQLTGNPMIENRLKLVQSTNESAETYTLIENLKQDESEEVLGYLSQLLSAHPNHVPAAQHALYIGQLLGREPGEWIHQFKPPLPLKQEWDILLFNHYAFLGSMDKAWSLWHKLRPAQLRESSLNMAAEMFVFKGEIDQAVALYEQSLAMDPLQGPLQSRVRELRSPFQPDHSLLASCRVNICLYSWNKASLLRQTLESLSQSDIGPARIDILLNGCTDYSRDVVEEARAWFPENEIILHDLHVNIGAPAARNWLLGLPEIRQSEYVAFLDDDVTVQKDWLSQFLTVAERDASIAVVGCKIVHPGTPAMLQYLYRHVAVADHGLLLMSNDTPFKHYDIGTYAFIRETRNVMGCQHLLRTKALRDAPHGFDIRFSPSQIDDIDHDLAMCLAGHKVMYCGTVTCVHHQSSGTNVISRPTDNRAFSNALGNDIKFFFKHSEHLDALRQLDCLSLEL
ncbi:glycosyltransferase family 2 protein [Pseudodesulfovibrio piezophilus]|uniref:Glycosyl transferase family 2 n=1 Tax=Pseudodesulfovibrio piezophilus (strain DSM 21447 / JCM 15486 / C1TLV30) TaxID=1322246 RepID=M1WQX8_PSEP2|nr:glycosyltransferase family 2 protein [Pseudodesulfovibrio piezophilus]CCH49239.1 Glycosyl transferase family 2 [Pseudodesulfovibrio piezophilus C1TLV30]